MRDEQDPGTKEMLLPRKRGRRPLNGEALTPAEKQARYRAARARAANATANPEDFSDTALLDRIRLSISDGASKTAIGWYVRELQRRYP